MKLLRLCVTTVLVAGLAAAPLVARAQALGETATLNSGVSAAGSGAGSALGRRIGGAMASEGHRVASHGKTQTSGGVVNLHWSGAQRVRYGQTEREHAHAKMKSGKAQPAFVIYGADSGDSGAASQPKPDAKAKKDSGSGQDGKK
jgi:hypothetical protein